LDDRNKEKKWYPALKKKLSVRGKKSAGQKGMGFLPGHFGPSIDFLYGCVG
jgi:hypothetical protein